MITPAQYRENKKRLAKAEVILDEMEKDNLWEDEKYKLYVKKYGEILEENLEFEKFHKINQT